MRTKRLASQKSEDEVDGVLNKTIVLFRFLIEKDVFERYYNGHLAKRLISSRSVSDDAERNMLAKFKIEAGAAFTKAAEGMMKDIKISEDTVVEYKRYQERQLVVRLLFLARRARAEFAPQSQKAPFEMSTIVCGSNFWPIQNKDAACVLPAVLLKGIDAFRKFYDTKHSGRILTFRSEHGSVEVKVKFRDRSHELTISTHAMVVLALFEGLAEDEMLSYAVRSLLGLTSSPADPRSAAQDIAKVTGMVRTELGRTLQTLACAKYKVLTKTPKGRDVDDTDRKSVV